MDTISKNIWGRKFFRKKIKSKTYEKTLFDGVSFKYVDFVNCIFNKCKFKNCHIGFDTTYTNCEWNNSQFTGKYSGFSGGRFDNCRFINVLIQSGLMQDLRFKKCIFSGKFKNLIFVGENDDNNWTTRFTDCDLSELILNNVSFVSGVNFSSTVLPKDGVRIFRNTNNEYTYAIHKEINKLDKENSIPLDVLSGGNGQELEVIDIHTIEHLFLDMTLALEAFERVAKDYEVTQQNHN